MVNDKPFTHPFRTSGGYYVYDVNSDAILKIDEEAYSLLKDGMLEGNTLIGKMLEDGYLSSRRPSQIVHSLDDVLPYYLENNLNMITLQITQQCNLRCSYCSFSDNYDNRNHSNKRMGLSLAKKGIDFLINHSGETNRVAVGFYGGEPLLEFDLIKECVEYAESKCEGRELTFSLTTNGTLFTDEIVEYFNDHKIFVTISLDGPKEVHNKNRNFAANGCGTFDTVIKNVEMIKSKYSEFYKKIGFNAVIDPNNDFGCTNQFFTNFDTIKDSMLRVSGISDMYLKNEDIRIGNDESNTQWNYESFKLFLSKTGRLDKKYTSKLLDSSFGKIKSDMVEKRTQKSILHDKAHHGGPCVPGVLRLFMNINGDFLPCERVSESSEMMKIGNVHTGFEIDKIRKLLNIGKISEESCKNCWAIRYCTLCAGFADSLTDLSSELKCSNCGKVRYNTEEKFKDYCTLKELGYDFDVKNDLIDALML